MKNHRHTWRYNNYTTPIDDPAKLVQVAIQCECGKMKWKRVWPWNRARWWRFLNDQDAR